MDLRGTLASAITGDVPGRFWPDAENPILYERAVNLVAGPSGVGKSLTVVKLVADLTSVGKAVIYCNAEDDPVMQSYRLSAAGANLDNVRLANFRVPDDLAALEYAIRAMDAKLVVFDTAAKHLTGPVQRWDNGLMRLDAILSATDCAAMFVHHTNKNVKASADWRAAIGGHTAGLIGTSRSIVLVGKRPDDAAQIVFCPVKDSYHETPKAIAFEFATEDFGQTNGGTVEIAYMRVAEKGLEIENPTKLVVIQGEGDGKKGPDPEKLKAAGAFLTEQLENGAKNVRDCYLCMTHPDGGPNGKCGHASVRVTETATKAFVKANPAHDPDAKVCPGCNGPVTEVEGLESAAEIAGIAMGTIKRAKPEYEIENGRKGFGPGSIVYWRLPDGHPNIKPGAVADLA